LAAHGVDVSNFNGLGYAVLRWKKLRVEQEIVDVRV
jgi:hypothetical protein